MITLVRGGKLQFIRLPVHALFRLLYLGALVKCLDIANM